MAEREAAPPEVHVLVSVDRAHWEQVESVARRLEAAGMQVQEVFSLSGTIAGAIPQDGLRALEAVDGVAAVEEEPTFTAL